MAAKRRALWQVVAAQLLLVAVPLYGSLPDLAAAIPTRSARPSTDSANILIFDEREGTLALVAVCMVTPLRELPRGPEPAVARARWEPKTRVWASSSAGETQPLAIQWFSCEITASNSVSVQGYDENGNRASLQHPNGVVTSYTYDAENRLTNLTASHTVAGVVSSFAYTLGPTGNRTGIVEQDGTAKSYAYDALYRLTDETVTQGTAPGNPIRWHNGFTYDPVGNRQRQDRTEISGSSRVVTYGYDERDRLTSETSGGATSYGWDENGNQISKSGLDSAVYTWDFENQLTRVVLANGTMVNHVYDVDGTRVRTTTTPAGGTPVVVDYLVDPQQRTGAAGRGLVLSQVIAETDGAGNLTSYYVRGDDLLAVLRPNAAPPGPDVPPFVARYFHADGLGSVRALTDETGAVTDRYEFEAFGTLLAHQGEDPNAYLFAGEALDPNSGFYYNRARWMQPALGRFTALDPLIASLRPGESNLYAYALNLPSDMTDPSGLAPPEWLTRLLVGTAVHEAIGRHFLAVGRARGQDVYSNNAIFTVLGMIFGACTRTDEMPCLSRPDLVNVSLAEVYEIKTVKQKQKGAAELALYLALLLVNNPARPWHPGTTYTPSGNLIVQAVGTTWRVTVYPPDAGVITYTAQDVRVNIRRVTDFTSGAVLTLVALATLTVSLGRGGVFI